MKGNIHEGDAYLFCSDSNFSNEEINKRKNFLTKIVNSTINLEINSINLNMACRFYIVLTYHFTVYISNTFKTTNIKTNILRIFRLFKCS